ncbi:hypothetical protein [Methylobacterium haplocladii]|uniref:hypothetical protein n=1 Tax=Methylobacterium haplocladii TaxID=1176176 RepID=UPI0011BE564A|nr:hypothetical protein [Methylobacterium haplocladii]GJD84554.1 hypothetical protein HPGCJGGD_2432 [Methylobacterium haplocladii]
MADYTCEECGTPHDADYDKQPYGFEKHDVDCLKCGNRMGTDSVFGMSLRIHREGKKPREWVRLVPR